MSHPEHPVPPSLALRVVSIVWWTTAIGLVVAARVFGWIDERDLADLLVAARDRPWMTVPAAIAVFVVGGAVLVPVTLMMASCGLLLGALAGFVHAAIGSLVAAALFHRIGHALGRPWVDRYAGPRLTQVTQAVAARGVLAVIALRLLPMAPHVVIAICAGALRISFRDFMLGSAAVSIPLALALTLLGGSVAEAGTDARTWVGIALAAVVMIAVGVWLLRRIIHRTPLA